MSKVTERQRMIRSGQPYTERRRVGVPQVEATLDGDPDISLVYVWHVFGHTLEDKFDAELEDFVKTRELHDLGQVATEGISIEVAAEWRGSLVGQYPIQ